MARLGRCGKSLAHAAVIEAAPRRSIEFVALVLLVAALWLTTRPYFGIVGDARPYAAQALNAIQNGRFADDMFFRFGSQDQFTLFSRLYGPFLGLLGVGHGALALIVLAQAIWIAGLIFLIHALTRDAWETLIVAAVVIAMPAAYGGLQYGEFYLTPRLFSEGLSMAALAVLLRGHNFWPLPILLVSASLHPLMTLPALAVWFCYQVRRNWRWSLVAIIPLAAGVALCLAGVAPFTWLGQQFDPAWFDVIRLRAPISLLLDWWWIEDLTALSVILVAICAVMLATGREFFFVGVVLAVGIGGLAVALVGDVTRDVLVVGAQTWRAMWLLAVVSYIVATISLLRAGARLRQWTPRAILLLAGLAMLLFARFVPASYGFAAVALLAGCLVGLAGRGASRAALLVALAMSGATVIEAVLVLVATAATRRDFFLTAFGSMVLTAVALSAAWFLVTAVKSGAIANRRVAGALGVIAVAACVVAGARWDQRTPWTRFVESGTAARDLAGIIPQRASVYWDGGIEMLWLGLDRPSFFSCTQGVGVVFNRGTAMAYAHRRASLFPLKERDFEECVEHDDGRQLAPGPDELKRACRREPELDYLVLGRRFPGVPAREWQAPVPLTVERPADPTGQPYETQRFYIYSCADIRASGT